MNKILRIVILSCIWFNSAKVSAQLDTYLNAESDRIKITQQTEIEIQNFIHDNFNNYILSPEGNDKINHRHDEDFTPAELEQAIAEAKKHELRKLFFAQNPSKKEAYMAKPIPQTLSQQCVNGDFENGTAGYSFWSDAHPQPASGTAFFFIMCNSYSAYGHQRDNSGCK